MDHYLARGPLSITHAAQSKNVLFAISVTAHVLNVDIYFSG